MWRGRGWDLDLHAIEGVFDHEVFSGGVARELELAREREVIVCRVVVRHDQALDASSERDLDRVDRRGVSEAHALGVLFGEVLRIHHEDLRVPGERDQRVLATLLDLDITGEDHRAPFVFDAKSARAGGVAHLGPAHVERAVRGAPADGEIMERELRRDDIQADGKRRAPHLLAEHLMERGSFSGHRVKRELGVGVEQRGEEGEPLDVIPVHVRLVEGGAIEREALGAAELGEPGAAVDDHAVFASFDLEAGRRATVSHKTCSRNRNATACAPKRDLHLQPLVLVISAAGADPPVILLFTRANAMPTSGKQHIDRL